MKIGIMIADDVEFAPFEKAAQSKAGFRSFEMAGCPAVSFEFNEKHTVTAVYCGIGKVNAASAVTALILSGTEAVICAGLSGAISGVRRNMFVVGDRYLQADVDMTVMGLEMFTFPRQKKITEGDEKLVAACLKALPNAVCGMIGSGDYFLADTDKKTYFRDTVGLTAFDMESAANAAVCDKNGIPYVAVRLISDDAGDCAVDSYRDSFEFLEKQELTDAVFKCIEQL